MYKASVVVRCKNRVTTLERTLVSLRKQTVPIEVITVDSGSDDGSLEIARRHSDVVICLPQTEFTYGRALNIGTRAASGHIVFALSAHCHLTRGDWVANSLRHYGNPNVVGTNGHDRMPNGDPLEAPYFQSLQDVRNFPYWGFSNHASSWRRTTWSTIPFDEDIPACEDKFWAWQVLSSGYMIVYDPALHVPLGHRRKEGPAALFRRTRREAYAFGAYMPVTPLTLKSAGKLWWEAAPGSSRKPLWMRRLGHFRMAEIMARYIGEREGWRQRTQGSP